MNKVTIRGPAATVQWSYHCAASLGPWTLTAGDSTLALTASVVSADTYRLSQPALTFRVPRPTGQPWVWPVTTLRIADGTLTATLGPQE